MPSVERVEKEIHRILKIIQSAQFESCLPLEKGYKNLTFHAGIYALKSEGNEILYIGKASAFRTRFQNGHQALNQMFLDGWSAQSVRVVAVHITARYLDALLTIEKGLIFAAQPSSGMFSKREKNNVKAKTLVQQGFYRIGKFE